MDSADKSFSAMDPATAGLENRQLQKRLKFLTAAAAVAFLVSLASIAAVISVGVQSADNHNKIDDLSRKLTAAELSAAASTPRAASQSSAAGAVTAAPSNVDSLRRFILVDNPASIENGFKLSGHLFEGSGYWSELRDMLYQRSDHQVVAVGDLVYVFGGLTDNNGKPFILDALTVYDTQTNTMIPLANMTEPRFVFTLGEIDGKVYVAAGITEFTPNPTPDSGYWQQGPPSASMDIYDVKTNKWSKGPSMKYGRTDACGAALDGKFYVMGGWGTMGQTLSSVEVYDPSTNEWSEVANLTSPRGDLACTAVDGKLYAIGGFADTGYEGYLEVFDPLTNTWTPKSKMIFPRGDFAVTPLSGGRILAMGGEIKVLTKDLKTYKDVNLTKVATHRTEEYIIEHDIWVQMAPMSKGRFRTAAAAVKDFVYLFGGHPTCEADKGLPECYKMGLKGVYAYLDTHHPNIYVAQRQGQ